MPNFISKLSLRVRLLITFIAVFTIGLAAFAVLALSNVYDEVITLETQGWQESLEFSADVTPYIVLGDYIGWFIDTFQDNEDGDLSYDTGLYDVILATQRWARGADPDMRIHTIAISPLTEEPVYIASTEALTDPDNAPTPGTPFEDPALYEAHLATLSDAMTIEEMESGVLDIEAEPIITDITSGPEGLTGEAYVPLYTQDGTVVGLAWIDVGPVEIADIPQRIVNASLGTALIVYPFLIIVVIFTALQIANPLRKLTNAGQVIASGEKFKPESLANITQRGDELGEFASVFSKMAVEVQEREEKLKQQVVDLRIEIDEVKKQRAVEAITESDSFQEIKARARAQREARQAGAKARAQDQAKPEADKTPETESSDTDDFLSSLQAKAQAQRARQTEDDAKEDAEEDTGEDPET